MDTKHLSGVIPLDLHQRASEEIRATESTMSKYLEMVIREHYEKGANKNMKTRTLAFQVSEELFQRIDEYLERYKNAAVRQELDRAQEQQIGMPDPRRGILDMAMDSEMNNMHEQMIALQRENEELQKEIARLRKGLDRKALGAIAKL